MINNEVDLDKVVEIIATIKTEHILIHGGLGGAPQDKEVACFSIYSTTYKVCLPLNNKIYNNYIGFPLDEKYIKKETISTKVRSWWGGEREELETKLSVDLNYLEKKYLVEYLYQAGTELRNKIYAEEKRLEHLHNEMLKEKILAIKNELVKKNNIK